MPRGASWAPSIQQGEQAGTVGGRPLFPWEHAAALLE